jgi:hypothetical protein
MTHKQADEFNRREFRKYREAHPDLFLNDELLDRLGKYFALDGLELITASMIESIIEHYRDAGLLPERPEPVDEPELTISMEPIAPPSGPIMHKGIDPDTGLEREYSEREVNRMSADAYRKRFPTLGTMAELLFVMRAAMTYTTYDAQMERYSEPFQKSKNLPALSRDDELSNEQAIGDLLV